MTCDIDTDFESEAAGLPLRGGGHNPSKVRIFKMSARLLNTCAVRMCATNYEIHEKQFDHDFTGDYEFGILGTDYDLAKPLWHMKSVGAFPLEIASVSLDGVYEI